MSRKPLSGYLVVGDISGYTSYVATTELEHAQEVLAELLELIVARFQPLLTVMRLEGDAVFAHAPDGQIARGETLVELLETTYTAFRDHIRGIVQRTTCQCNACRAIPTLDLKFIVHYGEYVVQQISGIKELVGTEVNRLFRLGKNHVTQETGWNAYILLTAASLEQLGLSPEGLHQQAESYEHLGEIMTYAIDLHARYKAITDARHVVLSPEEAYGTLIFDLPAPKAVVWEWLNDPIKRNKVNPHVSWSAQSRSGGRTSSGSTNHCAHGKNGLTCETILDWRPFEYVTTLMTNDKLPDRLFDQTVTIELESLDGGRQTRVHWHVKLERLPGWLGRPLLKGMFFKGFQKDMVEPLERLLREEMGEFEQLAGGPVGAASVPSGGD